jgi:hypothetical protein
MDYSRGLLSSDLPPRIICYIWSLYAHVVFTCRVTISPPSSTYMYVSRQPCSGMDFRNMYVCTSCRHTYIRDRVHVMSATRRAHACVHIRRNRNSRKNNRHQTPMNLRRRRPVCYRNCRLVDSTGRRLGYHGCPVLCALSGWMGPPWMGFLLSQRDTCHLQSKQTPPVQERIWGSDGRTQPDQGIKWII